MKQKVILILFFVIRLEKQQEEERILTNYKIFCAKVK